MTQMTQSRLNDAGPNDQPVPVVLAKAVVDNEQAIRQFLDGQVEKLLTGETEAVRDDLRGLARADKTVFMATALSVGGHEQFFEDVRKADIDAVETLEGIHDSYAALADEFGSVATELNYGLRNPSPGISTAPEFVAENSLPLMECDLTSGEVVLGEFRVPPSQAVALADALVAHAKLVVQDAIETHDEVAPTEVERLQDNLEEIGSTVAEAESRVNTIGDTVLAERDRIDELEDENANYYFN